MNALSDLELHGVELGAEEVLCASAFTGNWFGDTRRTELARETILVAEMTSTAEDLFRKLGERYVAKGKPVTTQAGAGRF